MSSEAVSARGLKWLSPDINDRDLSDYARAAGLDVPLAALLMARGVEVDAIEPFLNPTLKREFPDPSSLKDMDNATELIAHAIENDRKVAVLADYDVDGATSAAQLIRYFRAFDREVSLYVPDRIKEGYGPSPAAFQHLKDAGMDLVITVDCGAAAEAALSHGADIGLDIVVIDHHLMGENIPACSALVNPNRPDCASGQGHLAAAGVVYVLLASLNRFFRTQRGTDAKSLPDLLAYLDLCALGTLCDMAPLEGVNRAFVVQGLRVVSQDECPGVLALSTVSGRSAPRTVTDLTFGIGPQLNAGGRIGDPWLATKLLAETEFEKALPLAEQLQRLNEARKEIEADIQHQARIQISKYIETNPNAPVLIAGGEGWHPGVIGIVAGRLKDEFHKPVAVVGWGDEFGDVGKGSARSVRGMNIGAAIVAASADGVLVTGGGHAMAGGFSVEPDKLDDLRAYLAKYFAEVDSELEEARTVQISFDVLVSALSPEFLTTLEKSGPFGAAAPKPILRIRDAEIIFRREIGKNHLKVTVDDGSGRLDCVCWRSLHTPMGDALKKGNCVDIIGYAERDTWKSRQGKEAVQFEIFDVMQKTEK